MLDLGGQRQADGALTPREEIREPPVGDHHVGQRVGGERHLLERRRAGLGGQAQLEHPDRLAAVRHRGEHADSGRAVALDLDGLSQQRAALDGVPQRHPLGRLPALGAPVRVAARGRPWAVIQPDQRTTAEIGDQERDLRRAEGGTQAVRQRLHGVDRRCILDGGEQLGEIQPAE